MNAWVASGATPFVAWIEKLVSPAMAAAATVSVAVPSWLSTNVTPVGSAPFSVIAGTGRPVVVTVNVPPVPALKVAVPGLVMTGAAGAGETDTWNVGVTASGATPFDATTLNAKLVVPAGGVPDTTPEPAATDNHPGAPAANANTGAGLPDAANAYEYTDPTTAVNGGDSAVNTGAAGGLTTELKSGNCALPTVPGAMPVEGPADPAVPAVPVTPVLPTGEPAPPDPAAPARPALPPPLPGRERAPAPAPPVTASDEYVLAVSSARATVV